MLKTNKGPIWEIFEEMRKEMIETKKGIQDEIEEAKEEKKMIESNLGSITFSKKTADKWRKIRRSLDFWILSSRSLMKQKLHGTPLFHTKDSERDKFDKISELRIHYTVVRRRKRCMFYPDSNLKNYWSYFLIILLVYTIVMVPLTLSVIDIKDSTEWFYLDQTVNLFFSFDILVNLRTSIDYERDSCKEIFMSYATSWLLFDLVAIVPFDLFLEDNKFELTLLSKVPRFLRLLRIFKLLRFGSSMRRNKWYKRMNEFLSLSPAASKLIQFFLTMLVIIHITGCLWLFLAKINDFGPNTWVFE